jgi:hypothetical protein
VLNYVELAPGFSVQEMAVPMRWMGKSVRERALPRRRSISVVLAYDVLLGRVLAVPNPDSVLKEPDTLLVAGSDENLLKAARIRCAEDARSRANLRVTPDVPPFPPRSVRSNRSSDHAPPRGR